MHSAQDALENVKAAMAKAGSAASREAHDIALIAISKTRSTDEVRPLLEAGHRIFGENKVQEAASKWPELQAEYPDVELHLVGQLQSHFWVPSTKPLDRANKFPASCSPPLRISSECCLREGSPSFGPSLDHPPCPAIAQTPPLRSDPLTSVYVRWR